MEFNLQDMEPLDRYKLIIGAVVPRPIAFLSSVSADGIPNAAPFSFFNVFGASPAVVVLGINTKPNGPKDSHQNILETGDFVINIVNYALAEKMNSCAADVDADVDEFELFGLTQIPSALVKSPRIAESPVHLECRFTKTVEVGSGRALILGEIIHIHVDDSVLRNGSSVDQQKLDVVARMGGLWYSRSTDLFQMERPVVPA